jgi:hypothetical protein
MYTESTPFLCNVPFCINVLIAPDSIKTKSTFKMVDLILTIVGVVVYYKYQQKSVNFTVLLVRISSKLLSIESDHDQGQITQLLMLLLVCQS